ncbi:hypothetical protein AAVH_29057 [Aphelenchoides avenae]|nr:hypothetical protein AAVH_29057 [Aphelenchus avenae]
MESTSDEVPTKRGRIEGKNKTQLSQDTMLQVLLWLDRFDLDNKQKSGRRLRSLVENNRMPLRSVYRVAYRGDYFPRSTTKLSICLEEGEWPPKLELWIETDADAQKAASYLSSCFVRDFWVHSHYDALPTNTIIAAPALIRGLQFERCNFNQGEKDTLSEMLSGSTFQSLELIRSHVPAWQIDNKRLQTLRLGGCNGICVRDQSDNEKFAVTEEEILSYCFTPRNGASPVPERRFLRISWPSAITPAFFKKAVEASKNSQLTCDVELCLQHLRFDVGNLDLGVLPSRSQTEYRHLSYDIADHGNGVRLLIHFKSTDDEEWRVILRHEKKDHGEFFDDKDPMIDGNGRV